MIKNLKLIICISFVFASINLLSQTKTTYYPLNVGKHWSKRIVTEVENNKSLKRYYYRPNRFETMELKCEDNTTIQLRAMLKEKADKLDFSIIIENQETKYTLNIMNNDNKYYYADPININIPSNVNSIRVKTRNPNAYFRHYRFKTTKLQPITKLINPETYHKSYTLTSTETKSDYFSSTEQTFLTYKITKDGDAYFFVRSIKDNSAGATIDIFLNNDIYKTIVLSKSTSKDYKIDNQEVSLGKKIEINNLKENDILTIIPKTNHEIIVRMFLTTQPN
ncbi:MAG: hypothetical protein PHY08_02030 [Candidatus Cloacimonetes bacterium]|nr:hypothetical protein [Candidatus Cloacimonadota bacterium]